MIFLFKMILGIQWGQLEVSGYIFNKKRAALV